MSVPEEQVWNTDVPDFDPNEYLSKASSDGDFPLEDDSVVELDAVDAEADPNTAEAGAEEGKPEKEPPKADEESEDVTVRLNDGTEVSLGELEQTYVASKSTEGQASEYLAASEHLKGIETNYRSAAAEMSAKNDALVKYLEGLVGPEPDISLISTDPASYQYQKALRDQSIAELNNIKGMVAETQAVDAGASQERLTAVRADEERKLIAAMPTLASPAERAKFDDNVTSTAKQFGFTDGRCQRRSGPPDSPVDTLRQNWCGRREGSKGWGAPGRASEKRSRYSYRGCTTYREECRCGKEACPNWLH